MANSPQSACALAMIVGFLDATICDLVNRTTAKIWPQSATFMPHTAHITQLTQLLSFRSRGRRSCEASEQCEELVVVRWR